MLEGPTSMFSIVKKHQGCHYERRSERPLVLKLDPVRTLAAWTFLLPWCQIWLLQRIRRMNQQVILFTLTLVKPSLVFVNTSDLKRTKWMARWCWTWRMSFARYAGKSTKIMVRVAFVYKPDCFSMICQSEAFGPQSHYPCDLCCPGHSFGF